MRRLGLGLVAMALLIAACGGDGDEATTGSTASPACNAAFEEAGPGSAPDGLVPAVSACPTMEEWTAAGVANPEVFDGVRVPPGYQEDTVWIAQFVAQQLCATDAALRDSDLCLELFPLDIGQDDDVGTTEGTSSTEGTTTEGTGSEDGSDDG